MLIFQRWVGWGWAALGDLYEAFSKSIIKFYEITMYIWKTSKRVSILLSETWTAKGWVEIDEGVFSKLRKRLPWSLLYKKIDVQIGVNSKVSIQYKVEVKPIYSNIMLWSDCQKIRYKHSVGQQLIWENVYEFEIIDYPWYKNYTGWITTVLNVYQCRELNTLIWVC